MIESHAFGDVYLINTEVPLNREGSKQGSPKNTNRKDVFMHCINKSKFSKRERTFFMKQAQTMMRLQNMNFGQT